MILGCLFVEQHFHVPHMQLYFILYLCNLIYFRLLLFYFMCTPYTIGLLNVKMKWRTVIYTGADCCIFFSYSVMTKFRERDFSQIVHSLERHQ